MAATHRDEAGWNRAIKFMQESMGFLLKPAFTDQDAADVSKYLSSVFGVNSELPQSPAGLPGYNATVRPFSDEAMRIVYVDYELPRPNSFPWSGAPDKDGKIWVPYFGTVNRVGRLDPNTGEIQEFRAPYQGAAGIHSAVRGPDGIVWFSEQGSNRIGRLDPGTTAVTEYPAGYLPGKEGLTEGGEKHTIRIDPAGYVWSTGTPLSRFDPMTGKFTEFKEVPSSYGIALDKDGNAWFTEFRPNGKIGKVDAKTGKVTKWAPPTPNARPRRIQIDPDGIVWFAEFRAGKIGRFDPKTEIFKEFPLPGPDPSPYAFGLDRNQLIWYSSSNMDIVGCLDPKTGKVIEYPFPYPENGMIEFFLDSQDRMWFGTPPNNKVGYFILQPGS